MPPRRRPERQNGLVSRCCPRCGGELQPPDLMDSRWRCEDCGPVSPLHCALSNTAEVLADVRERVRSVDGRVPLWCPWPMPAGWTIAGVAWAGDERTGPRATALAMTGPSPISPGPAEIVFVAEEPGIGLGTGLAGRTGADPGSCLDPWPTNPYGRGSPRSQERPAGRLATDPAGSDATAVRVAASARLRASGHPTPLWAIDCDDDCCTYVGEARGLWLMAIAWPAEAGYLLAEDIALTDLADGIPTELVFGAPSRQLSPHRRRE